MITKYHAKYYALLLVQKSVGDDIGTLSQSLLSASVDINPHQIDAALFAFKSPLSKGVVLADEVGLGKTIEAGLVLCQYWAMDKCKILIVCPASLRKQWSFELTDKFGIDNEILDTKNYNEYTRIGRNPFGRKKAIICSYNFVAKHKTEVILHNFDIAVIDEAHKLRNVYRKSNKVANAIKDALANTKKLLLTATPFQNSLMELYGLTSVIDDNIFGSDKTFRSVYGSGENNADLRYRLRDMYKRTLRKDVKEYINYTNRHPMTQYFDSTDEEYELYTAISEFLRRTDIYSVPRQQQKLTTMIIRKILASSTTALIATLTHVNERLERMLETEVREQISFGEFIEDADDIESWGIDIPNDFVEEEDDFDNDKIDIEALKEEIATIQGFIDRAKSVSHDSKSEALLLALEQSFKKQQEFGANRKALIFTESTKTQSYLKEFLEKNGYAGKIVLFNGRGADPESTQIYQDWCNRYPHKKSGIIAADRRMAIVDYFRESADIMIATEAAAEGLNLQFCSLVINYDLPWNPQRIEQRIGRCHRYGQKFDVVVVNFVNNRNHADVRVFTLLKDKFSLFDDIFGASDEVLGQADAIDFETRIWEIYQICRTDDEINAAFERLQEDMKVEIDEQIASTREQILENFDIDVQEHLRIAKSEAGAFLNRYEHIFWELTRYILKDKARFDENSHSFYLFEKVANCPFGKYDLLSQLSDGIPYRLSHPLAQYVLNQALNIETNNDGNILFDSHTLRINVAISDEMYGQSGYLALSLLDISSLEKEQYTLFTAITDDGRFLTQNECEKLFLCGGVERDAETMPDDVLNNLKINAKQHSASKLQEVDSRNLAFYKEEETRIYRWEQDVVDGLEREIDTIKRAIREAERDALKATNIMEQMELQQKAEDLRRQKRRKRNELEDREDEVASRRKKLIGELKNKMIQTTTTDNIFYIRWEINA